MGGFFVPNRMPPAWVASEAARDTAWPTDPKNPMTTMKRRPFLKTAIGTTLAAALARGQEAEEAPRKLGWALVGLGSLSTNQIAPALQKTSHSRLAAVVTGTPRKGVEWREQYGIGEDHVYNYENFDRIIDDPTVDVVCIVLPNSMHHEFTIRAAKAGKHVYCEKPMANTSADCREMIEVCEEANVRLGVAYRCQFEPHHIEAVRFAKEEVFGKLCHVDAGFGFRIGDPNQWRLRRELAGGGALMDVGVYAIQTCRMLTGEEPTIISALETKTDAEKFAEVDETIQWMTQFPSGRTANCLTTYAYNGVNFLTAVAERGRFGINNAYNYSGQSGWTSRPDVPLDFPQIDHFAAQMDAFSKAIMEEAPFEPSGYEGLKDLLVVEAIYRSIETGRAQQVEAV